MSQYALNLTLPAVFSEDNFVVSDCNRKAHMWVTRWPDWPSHTLYLYGPEASGKSHLGHIWARKASAAIMPSGSLAGHALPPQPGNWLIENIEQLTDERALLHWFNYSREQGHYLLLTGSIPARQLPLTLPDLTSRLFASPAVGIETPDDHALAASMRKQFADRQLKVDDELIAYLLPRVDRSFIKINELVRLLDQAALSEQRRLTIPFIRQHLG